MTKIEYNNEEKIRKNEDCKVGDHHKTDLLPIFDITIYESQL